MPRPLQDPLLRVAVLTALVLIAQAVIAKNVLDVQLDAFTQTAALWVFIVYALTNDRGRTAELGADLVVILVAAAVLTLYAF